MKIIDNYLLLDDFLILKKSLLQNKLFPYYLRENQVTGDIEPYLAHHVVLRPEERTNKEDICSPAAFPIIKQLLLNNDITNFEILRASINLTFRSNYDRNILWHFDHEYDYKHLIYYLTTHDNAPTVIKNKEGEEIVVDAFANRAVFFDKELHRLVTPECGIRAVIVVTYKELNEDNNES